MQFFNNIGFDVKVQSQLDEGIALSSLKGSEKDHEIREQLKRNRLWVIKRKA